MVGEKRGDVAWILASNLEVGSQIETNASVCLSLEFKIILAAQGKADPPISSQ